MSSTNLPDYYFKPGTEGAWVDEADEIWAREHSFDEFGNLLGPLGRIPSGSSLGAQETHNQLVFRARNRLGQSASAWAQGALGLLQSFRPGGGAAIEANAYGQLAQIDLQRAGNIIPMDLLGDYRRDQAHKSRVERKKASTTQAITTGVGALLSLIPGVGSVLGPMVMGMAAPLSQALHAERDPTGGMGYSGQGQSWNQRQAGYSSAATTGLQSLGKLFQSGPSQQGDPSASQQAFGQDSTGWQPAGGKDQSLGSQGMDFGGARLGQEAGPGGQAGGAGQSRGLGGGRGDAGGGYGSSVVGQDGLFTTTSYAKGSSYDPVIAPAIEPFTREIVVDEIWNDSFWTNYSTRVDQQIEARSWYGGIQP